MPHGKTPGHTLVELLIVLGLAGAFAAMSVPTFRELGANVRRDARVEDLRGALLLARAEALARGVPVVVCASRDGGSCTGADAWSAGWLVAPRGEGAAPLQVARDAAGVYVGANRPAVEFQPTAEAATTATFTVCDGRGARAARGLVVSRTGRVRLVRDAGLRCG
jgi:type IV fimbrial biogenesis protein FimT